MPGVRSILFTFLESFLIFVARARFTTVTPQPEKERMGTEHERELLSEPVISFVK